jgi:hypothetical protein
MLSLSRLGLKEEKLKDREICGVGELRPKRSKQEKRQ